MSRGAVYHYFKTKEDIINASSPEVEPVAEILDLLGSVVKSRINYKAAVLGMR